MNQKRKITITIFFTTVAVAFFILFGSLTYSAKNRPPVVSNVHAQQRPGTEQAIITYDVDDPDGDTLTISVQMSNDNGQTFTVLAKSFSGDIGAGINPGKNKRIVWDAGKDLTELYDWDFRAKVIADDSKQPDEIIWQKDGAKMRLIPAGEFEMGSNDGSDDEMPVHTVYVDAFYMDVYEVTVGQYKQFIQETGHKAPDWLSIYQCSPTDNHPIIYVSWDDAQAYCQWAGKRLPTEAEWEKAARGGLMGKKYPWGNSNPDGSQCNFADKNTSYSWSDQSANDEYQYTAPVGSFPPNGYGLYDMAGNVWEWCSDWYDINYYSFSPREKPTGPTSGTSRVVRGGSWVSNGNGMRAEDRSDDRPNDLGNDNGFRCCAQDVTP